MRIGNVNGINETYRLDSDTTIEFDGEKLEIRRSSATWDEQGCLIPLLAFVFLFESIFFVLMSKLVRILIVTGVWQNAIVVCFFLVADIPGVAVMVLLQHLIFPFHCTLDFLKQRYTLSNGVLRISAYIPNKNADLAVNFLHGSGDWGFGLKIPVRIFGVIVNLPVIPGRMIGSKSRTRHEIGRLKEWLHRIPNIEISMQKKTGKWSMPRTFAVFMGALFLLGVLLFGFLVLHQTV